MDSEGTTSDHVKCIKQLVLSVARNVKFLSDQWKASLFIARIVTEIRKDSNLNIIY